jgi:hypothetical protein
MSFIRGLRKQFAKWYWLSGPIAVAWLLIRSGSDPKRLAYPCQQAAMPLVAGWVIAAVSFLAGSMIIRRFAKLSAAVFVVIGAFWLVGSVVEPSRSEVKDLDPLPTWKVFGPISKVFVMDNIPSTAGSLAAGDASVPDEYLVDPAVDTLLNLLETQNIHFYRDLAHPDGIVGADNVVIIKANLQWTERNTTSTDRIKGVIWRILQHPDGFSGEIIVCDNTQNNGTGINHLDNNSEDTDQSIVHVINTFSAKGYPVYLLDWYYIWDFVADEYSDGDMIDGYVYDPETKITYPKFETPSNGYYVSMRCGIWDDNLQEYNLDQLCIINFPVLKHHSLAGSTIAIKNWIGVATTAYPVERYGSWNNMHNSYYFGQYALVAKIMAATFPRLSIVDAAWTTLSGPIGTDWVYTGVLAASTDPSAVSYYTAKHVLTPLTMFATQTDPDRPGSKYNGNLTAWTDYLRNTAGFPCTRDSADMSIFDRSDLILKICGDVNGDDAMDILDIVALIDTKFKSMPPPERLWLADVNSDNIFDILDIVYLIDFKFKDGDDPVCNQ